MSVSATNNVVTVSHTVQGTGPYLFPGSLMELDDLGVYVVDEQTQTISEVERGLYTLTANESGLKCGASVTLSETAGMDGKRLVLRRRTDLTQETEIPLAGRLSTVALEAALDRSVLRDAEIWQQLDRAIRVPDGEEMPDLYGLFRKFEQVSNLSCVYVIDESEGAKPSVKMENGVLTFTLVPGKDGKDGEKGEKGDKGDPGEAYTLPTASASTLGGVKIGTGLSVSEDGTLSATATSAEWGKITGTLSDQTDLSAELDAKLNVVEGVQGSTDATLTVSPGKAYRWEPTADGTLALSDEWILLGNAECLISINPGTYSISGGRVRIVDSLEASKWNECVLRWDGYGARLYVVDSVDDGTITAPDRTVSGTRSEKISVDLSDQVTVSNGELPTFVLIFQELPDGLSLSSDGVLSGRTAELSSTTVTVTVTAAHCNAVTFKLTISITEKKTEIIYTVSAPYDPYNNGDYIYNATNNTAVCAQPEGYASDGMQRRLAWDATNNWWVTQTSSDGASWGVPQKGYMQLRTDVTSDIDCIVGTKQWFSEDEEGSRDVTVTKKTS